MKKFLLLMVIALFGVNAVGAAPAQYASAYDQKKGDDKKKDPPGPPVVRPKEPKGEKPKQEPPKKNKRPE
ncbi:MAG TPA: hypothetical protein VNN73_01690 [Blastocatellia bacterium]|nr:hypothetical protein [Blastocatellia bacterium]